MSKITIALGTTSEQKLSYLKEVLDEIGIQAEIHPIEVESKVSGQPTTEAETKKGSLNRAKSALKKIPKADIGLGIEVGYNIKKGKYCVFCYASIIDKENIKISAKSHEFPLPDFHDNKIKTNQHLHEHYDEYISSQNDQIKKFIGEIIRNRKPFITEACKSALLQYFIDD